MKAFLDYFLYPKKTGYTFDKTLVYGIVFITIAYLIYIFLKKLKIKIDRRLAIAILPFILFGSTLRVYEDLEIAFSYWIVTPGIYFLICFMALSSIIFGKFLEIKFRVPYEKVPFIIGIILWSITFIALPIQNYLPLTFLLIFFTPFFLFSILLKKTILKKIEDFLVLNIQTYDSIVTFIALIFFGLEEQHVLPSYLFNFFGPEIFPVTKFLTTLIVLFVINKLIEDENFKKYVKMLIAILGLATGTRDLILLLSLA